MTALDDIPVEDNPTHFLYIADTKNGKTTYAAQCAMEGHHLLYIDSDNGLSAVQWHLRNSPKARERVRLFRTQRPALFQDKLLTEGIFRWNITRDNEFASGLASPTDKMVEIIPSRIPKGLIIVNDSWTTTSIDAMELGATANRTTLEDMKINGASQAVYGSANIKLNLLLAVYQQCKFNLLVLAHPTVYEIYEKPKGRIADTKQKDMILLDSIKVPLSCSRPHGYTMGKWFTDIGWGDVDRMGNRLLDFELEYKRVGGGRPNTKGPVVDMSWTKLFGPPIPVTFDERWIRYYTVEEWKAKQTPAAKPAGVAASGLMKATPAKPTISSMTVKK